MSGFAQPDFSSQAGTFVLMRKEGAIHDIRFDESEDRSKAKAGVVLMEWARTDAF